MVLSVLNRLRQRDTEESEDEVDGRRPIYRTRSLSTFRIKKSIGWRIRDGLGYLETLLGPYLKKIFPNFIAVHYGYVMFMGILGSVIIYPLKNIKYIDALFLACCSATQAGLNTVDVNNLSLHQQITIYVITMLTTPIFIHGSLSFLRLYWFERHFDDIRGKSKLNFKMRRTATLAARTQSMERQRTLESQRSKRRQRTDPLSNTPPDVQLQLDADSPESKPEEGSSSSDVSLPQQNNPSAFTQSQADLYHAQEDDVTHMSEPSDEEDGDTTLPPQNRTIKFIGDDKEARSPHPERSISDIKFAKLPKPDRDGFDPKDVFMSIAMLRDKQQQQRYDSGENEGPALVVRGPAEREARRSSIQFELAKPKRPLAGRKRSGVRRSFRLRRASTAERSQDDITSLIENEAEDDDEEELNRLERAQSHLQLPSQDQSGGIKYAKRSNTLDVPTKKMALNKTPTFDKILKHRLKAPRVLRRRGSSTAIADDSDSYDDTDTDDEDDDGNGLRRQMSTTYLSWIPTVGRNSTFVNLSDQQKEELGGVEYRAIKLLATILVIYYVGFHIIGITFLLPWIIKVKKYQSVVRGSGVNLTWWGFFTAQSAFNDLGYTLTPDSMISFRDSPYALLVMCVLIIIGNTGFPILLRFIIWGLFKLSKDLSLFKESLGFLLDHPRRCFTLLFPSAPTWWLLFILLLLNAVDLILFIILDLNADVVDDLSAGHKVLDGLFQAVSTRTAGFACVDLSQLHPAVQVSYMVMMYISVMPLAISIRRTNVYEEQSLGVYPGQAEDHSDEKAKPTSYIGAHLRKQLSFDLWFVFLGLFIICIAEGDRIQDENEPSFTVFQVLFEVVSAYGTVGMSLGYPNTTPSFSGQFNVVSKLVIIAMMIRGRHRGLPYSLDRAIMLPSKKMEVRDRYQDMHAGHHLARTETVGSVEDPVIEFLKSAAPRVIRDRIKRPSFLSSKSDAGTSRSQRRFSSTGSAGLFTHHENDSEATGDYFSHRPTGSGGFRDVHFSHAADTSRTDIANESSTGENFELANLSTPSANGAPIHVAETAPGEEAFDIGSRRNSIQTL